MSRPKKPWEIPIEYIDPRDEVQPPPEPEVGLVAHRDGPPPPPSIFGDLDDEDDDADPLEFVDEDD